MFESKINRGRANGYAPLDGSGKVPLDKLPPIQSTIDTGSFAITGSNEFIGNQTISGSLTTTEFIQTSVIQATGSLYLQPDSTDNRHFEIYNTSPTDVHIKASSGISFFGDDTNYIKIDNTTDDVTIAAFSDIILTSDDGGVYIGSYGSGNGVVTNGYLNTIIGDTDIINGGTGNSITDVIGRIPIVNTGSFATTSSLQTIIAKTGSFATTGSNQFNGNQSISGSLLVSVSTGIPSGVSNWDGQGGWNQNSYTNVTASGGTGTGLTVDVAAGGGGYINIDAISINTPGSGYTNGDVVTINNENNLPGQFTVEVSKIDTLQIDNNGNLILDIDDVPTNLIGSVGDIKGTLKIDHNAIYFASQSFVPETYEITVNPGTSFNTHVSIPKNQGIPSLYSNGWSITTQDDTTYTLTGVYSDGDNWDCEIDNLNSNYNGGTQTMELRWLDYVATDIWKKIDFGFERGKFVENAVTSSFVKRVSIPTTLTGSIGDKGGTIAFDSEAIYFANDSYYGTGPFTVSLYQNMESTPNFPITKGNFPKPKIGWTVSWANGALTATVTNVVEYANYWLVYTNGGNSSISTPATITLTTNGLIDNVWLKQELISSSIINPLNTFTGSIRAEVNSIQSYTASLKTATLISGAAQITALGFVSSSSSAPAGTISGSSQLTASFDTRYTLSGSVQPLPSNLISSSAQITAFGFVSSSATIPAGTISGSSQLTTSFDIRYAPSASYLTSLNGAISSSNQLTSSLDLRYQLSGSAGVVPAGTISSSAQLTSSFDSRYVLETETGSLQNSITSLNTLTSSLATTGSNSFNGNQIVTGSLTVSSVATISASIAANASALTLSSGSNLYIQNNGVAEISGSLRVSGSLALTGSISISSGSIVMTNRPAFRVTGAGGPTYATTVLSGSMVVVDYNEGNHYNTTNGTFTAPIAGLYQVNLVCRTYSNSGAASQAVVVKNNTAGANGTVQIMLEWAANTTVNHMGGSTISKLAVGDTLKAVVFMGTSSFDGNDNFSVAYIG